MDHEDNHAAIRNPRSLLVQLFVMACLFASGLVKAQSAGDTAGDNAKASSQKAAASGAASSELKELKDAISTQQQQIQQACRGPRPSRQRRSGTCGSRRSTAI